jgi:hypothetical protein
MKQTPRRTAQIAMVRLNASNIEQELTRQLSPAGYVASRSLNDRAFFRLAELA